MPYTTNPQRYQLARCLALILPLAFCLDLYFGRTAYSCRSLRIDPDLRLCPQGFKHMREPASGEFYFAFNGASVFSVDHDVTQRDGHRARLLYLESPAATHVLSRTVKESVLRTGPYGFLYVERQCLYADRKSTCTIEMHQGDRQWMPDTESATALPRLPEKPPPVTSVSLVRIFSAASGYLVTVANYKPDGTLVSFSQEETKSPQNRETTYNVAIGPGQHALDMARFQVLARFGLPVHLHEDALLTSGPLRLPSAGNKEVSTLLYHHFAADTLISEDVIEHGLITETRFFQPTVTAEERFLNRLNTEPLER